MGKNTRITSINNLQGGAMQQVCTNRDFFILQAKIMQHAIEEDKWYLSEEQHQDVGWAAAEEHFLRVYASGFNAGYRACYCALHCPYRKDCEQAQRWIEH